MDLDQVWRCGAMWVLTLKLKDRLEIIFEGGGGGREPVEREEKRE